MKTKKKSKQKKLKELKLPMKFNPGTKKYEPSLPIVKKGKKVKLKDIWKIIIFLLILILVLVFMIMKK